MTGRDFWTHDRLHVRPDRADWARYQAGKAGQGFRMPHMPKRKWSGTKPAQAAPADPIASLRAEVRAVREEVKMQSERIVKSVVLAAAVIVAVIVLTGSAVLIMEGVL